MNYVNYLAGWVAGLLQAIVSDPIVTALAVGSIALGFATSILWAFAAFFILYAVFRTINTVANAIGTSGQHLAQSHAAHGAALVRATQPIGPPPPPTPGHEKIAKASG